ncbi:hypothetical protein [Bacillus sp. HSf4]|uniref:hypothetical protein n=1 Tax=Bacillus sp. HSf4 TaxID=3035514 RepID=UPI002408FAB9|nr:hypothetical protein [Bacillus sp. HSf4]WFA06078.1 hypothetical protein P3X63_04505 [Bacillus sp. HSf4]
MKLHKGSAGICLMVFGLLLCAKTHRQVKRFYVFGAAPSKVRPDCITFLWPGFCS